MTHPTSPVRAVLSGPPVLSVRDGQVSVLLRRETEEDLLSLDPGFAV